MKKIFAARWTTAAALAASALVALPAQASPAGDNLVINEVYANGGSVGASYKTKFVELYNPTDKDISISGWSLQYRTATGTSAFSGVIPLGDHHIEPLGTFLVSGGSNGANGLDLPPADVTGASANAAGGGGTFALSKSTAVLAGVPSAVLADANVVDLVGYGSSTTFEGAAAASGNSVALSLSRVAGADTDQSSTNFAAGGPTPVACGDVCDGGGGVVMPPTDRTIAEIQGPGAASPFAGQQVTTTGVVTAVYKTGGFSGAYIQTAGTGGDIDLPARDTSDGIFVFSSAFAADVNIGDFVETTGGVSEFNGMTELSTSAGNWTVLAEAHAPVTPADVSFPMSETSRESLEGMLLLPKGAFTITNNYSTNQYAEIGLAAGTKPLDQPTNVARPLSAEYHAVIAANATKLVTLDDGASLNFLAAANQSTALPWLTADNEVRAGAPVAFEDPVVLDYRNNLWKLQPTQQLIAGGNEPVAITNTRTAAPEPVGGDVTVGTFNVLNYFTTVGEAYTGGTCTYRKDRAGANITVNSCTNNGPRGAANQTNLARQQAKIVAAINTLGADVVSLEEIENSAALGQPRDTALTTLVTALNAAAGADTWTAVPSPASVPTTGEDVIRTAFIYKSAAVQPVGTSQILDSPAFSNARAPLAQTFRPVQGTDADTFVAIVNHFKSKGSGSGEDADQGDGQGASNHARTLQAQALVEFAAAKKAEAGVETVVLTGDFNSYNEEDPVKVIEDAGYVNVPRALTDKDTYQFAGLIGSLDHVFISKDSFGKVSGADIWNINSFESVAREYSRFNYNATNFYQADPYRASDHDPEIIGLNNADVAPVFAATADPSAYGTSAVVKVTGDPDATGGVTVVESGKVLGTGFLVDGASNVVLGKTAVEPGTHHLTVLYAGDGAFDPASTTLTLTVSKAPTTTTVKVKPSKPVMNRSKVKVTFTVEATGFTVADGRVQMMDGDEVIGVGNVRNGKATVRLAPFTSPGSRVLTARYLGSAVAEPSLRRFDIDVVRR